MYRAKQKESEESVSKLEKKVQSVVRESQVIRESKEKQIGELKKMSDQSTDSLKNEWEKKLHAAVVGMEQEKFDLQKKQTENIQVLLKDTNQRLAKMEAEYGAQTQATVSGGDETKKTEHVPDRPLQFSCTITASLAASHTPTGADGVGAGAACEAAVSGGGER
eukprot:XP_014049596.1 PREDICTED: centrosomal protein of 112 kDa-like isoform X2 [Salmo salar]